MMSRPSGLYCWRYICPTLKTTPLSPRYTACVFTQSASAFSKQDDSGSCHQGPQDAPPLFPKYLMPFVLPNTLGEFVAEKVAREHWKEVFKIDNGRKPTSHEMPITGRRLFLLVDKRRTAKSVMFYPYGIRFSSGNAIGRSLWNMPHWVPWFKRRSLMEWLVLSLGLSLIGYLIFTECIFLLNLDRAPISGRLQYRIRSRGSHVEKDASVAKSFEDLKLIQVNDEELT